MDIMKGLQEYMREEFDRQMSVNEEYTKAEEELHRYIESELPHDKLEEMETLLITMTNAMFHTAVEIGMRYGAKLTVELLK